MRITPTDISRKCFMTQPEGLDSEEVYAFLEAIKEDMYELGKEKATLEAVNREQTRQIELTEAMLASTAESLKKFTTDMTEASRQELIGEMLTLLLPFLPRLEKCKGVQQ